MDQLMAATQALTLNTASPIEQVHPRGDIILVAEGGERFLVHSLFLRHSSSVWDDKLYSYFTNGHDFSADNPLLLSVEEQANTLFLLLLYIHRRSNDVPSNTSVELFAAVVMLANKYDCLEIVVETLVR
ncbi:hypothetical protein K461DRAFT_296456 [Myriangium duriaei CBS 260.36]|uniref:BTB domain-containing protein n=1 Tax=Myriangium duriaei CBS 260.36 TaxID=1168546 RepID=A0A9P4IU78_9PEZI|nr:hypothetical protein K461DRAFT_296456 [Myriangium duriaei CBS 260.36]